MTSKRAWKLQEFVAHGSNVNCLALGHKSGRVLVTGGDDKKVNLWAVGKANCIMSLCGHTTPVECVRFGHTEELVCAGSQSGALKIWDLEAARLVRTLTGHKSGLTCIDFHPYGDFLASGSTDTNLKLWDIRRKGCIFTYKGHKECVNSLKFSPDGQWIASAGEEGSVKIWDLRAGKLMTEFTDHSGPVHDVEFHPHEFLLASASRDRTVNFWDLESFHKVCTADRDTGPVRCITFHPEGDCLFSASHDSFKVHLWEPHTICDSILMGWGKVRDIAVTSTQLIAAAYQMSNVSLYVVDLKQVDPLSSKPARQMGDQISSTDNPISFKAGHHVRRSFVKEKPGPNRKGSDLKMEDPSSDRSGTDDSDAAQSTANINDLSTYEHAFRTRTELNRTPTRDLELDPPFEAPSGSESELPSLRPASLRITNHVKKKHPSPSPTRRCSQPAMMASSPTTTPGSNTLARVRRTSTSTRPLSVYEQQINSSASTGHLAGSPSRNQRSTSVQPRSAAELDYRTGSGDVSPPVPDSHGRAQSLHRQLPYTSNKPEITPLTPVSRIHIGGSTHPDRPLDRPTLVRHSRSVSQEQPTYYQTTDPQMYQKSENDLVAFFGTPKANNNHSSPALQQQQQQNHLPQQEKVDVIPQNADKPCGLEANDFLPKKFQSLTVTTPSMPVKPVTNNGVPTEDYGSRFSGYKGYQTELSESEVTSSILKGHESMMAVLTNRGRNIEITHKLWQNKDAKTAVEHAVSLNDQAVLVDLMSVIILRPSIWNLDLCTALLPSIGELLQSKYEMYINTGCGAMKLILKNFASVIKSNIDSPIQTVGVDISREERHNKCMQCYKDLVKIRSFILKRQTMQGKLGHTYRELSILMQYLD